VRIDPLAELCAVIESDFEMGEEQLRQLAIRATSRIDDPQIAAELRSQMVDVLEVLSVALTMEADASLVRGAALDILERIDAASR
jgi:hypothetical protein